MRPRVAVIGAGWAGLSCAVELARADLAVNVFEAGSVMGGRARVVEKDGWRVDNGQHILIGAYTETLKLMRFLGVSPKRLDSRRFHIHVPGRLSLKAAALPAPLHLAVGLLRASGLGWRDRLAALRLLRMLKASRFVLGGDCSVAELLVRTQQTATLRQLVWEPLCIAALNTPAERASAQVFANVLRDSVAANASASDILIPKVDLSELLPVPATVYLSRRAQSVHTSNRIRAIERRPEGFRLQGDPFDARFSHVVIATAPWHVADLTRGFAELERLRSQLDAMPSEAITTVYLAYDPPLALPETMIGLVDSMLQWVFDRGRLGGPSGLVAGVVSAASVGWPREAIALQAQREIEKLFAERGARIPAPYWSEVITEKRATFACEPGMFRPIAITPVKNLLLAGDDVASDYPATLESAVRSGIDSARTILRGLGIRTPTLFSLD